MLSGVLAVLQASMFDGLSLDPFSSLDDGCGSAEVSIGGSYVFQALVVAPVVIVLDERLDLLLQVTGQEVILQEDAVLQGLVPALNLALCLGMEWSAAYMAHAMRLDPLGQFTSDVAGAIVTEQPWFVQHSGLIAARRRERHAQRVGDVPGSHGRAKLPGDDVAREVIKDGRQVHPAPADDLEVGEVGLPHLVRPRGLGVELAGSFDHDIGR